MRAILTLVLTLLLMTLASTANAQVFSKYDPATGDIILDIPEQVDQFTAMIVPGISPDDSRDYRFRSFAEWRDGEFPEKMVISDWAIPNGGPSNGIIEYGYVLSTPWTFSEYTVYLNMSTMYDLQPVYDRVLMTVVPEPSTTILLGLALVGLVASRRSR